VAPKNTFTVDVSVEPRTPSELKRIARHVFHPFHSGTSGEYTPARPTASIRPHLPPELTRWIPGEVNVDVVVSLDKQGTVKNTEVTRGAGTELGMLAANTAGSVPWEPAHSGDRNVAMDVVVHYRFTPPE
jgi:outer membrane biosynthesis protein TonB